MTIGETIDARYHCLRCDHEWRQREWFAEVAAPRPKACPRCRTSFWDVPRVPPKRRRRSAAHERAPRDVLIDLASRIGVADGQFMTLVVNWTGPGEEPIAEKRALQSLYRQFAALASRHSLNASVAAWGSYPRELKWWTGPRIDSLAYDLAGGLIDALWVRDQPHCTRLVDAAYMGVRMALDGSRPEDITEAEPWHGIGRDELKDRMWQRGTSDVLLAMLHESAREAASSDGCFRPKIGESPEQVSDAYPDRARIVAVHKVPRQNELLCRAIAANLRLIIARRIVRQMPDGASLEGTPEEMAAYDAAIAARTTAEHAGTSD